MQYLLSPVCELHHEVENGYHHHKVKERVTVSHPFFLIVNMMKPQFVIRFIIVLLNLCRFFRFFRKAIAT